MCLEFGRNEPFVCTETKDLKSVAFILFCSVSVAAEKKVLKPEEHKEVKKETD